MSEKHLEYQRVTDSLDEMCEEHTMADTESDDPDLRVKDGESGVIFSPNGTMRLLVPAGAPDDMVNEGAIQALRVAAFFQCPEALKLVEARIEEVRGNRGKPS